MFPNPLMSTGTKTGAGSVNNVLSIVVSGVASRGVTIRDVTLA